MARWLVAAVMILAAASSLAAEKIYKWVDAEGGVHYSATPPPGQAVESQDLRYFRGDPDAAAAAQKQREEQIKQRREAETKTAQTAATQGTEAGKRRERCEQARGIISRMQAGSPVTRYKQDDGTYRRYDDAERARNLSDAQAAVQENCG